MPTTMLAGNSLAPTGPAPRTLEEALASLLGQHNANTMAGPMQSALSDMGSAPPSIMHQALASVGQPAGVLTPSRSTAPEGPQPQVMGGESDQLPMPSPSPMTPDLLNAGVKHPAFFGKGGLGWDIIGSLGDAFSGTDTYWRHKMQLRQFAHDDEELKLSQARENRIANRPVFNTLSNVGLVSTNPDTGESKVIQPSRSAAKAYVEDDLGLTPADPQYHVALADYLLKSAGPTAFQYRSALQDDRQEASAAMQDDRQAAAVDAMRQRLGLQEKFASYREGLRRSRPAPARIGSSGGNPTRSTNAVIAPILLKMAQGQPLTPGEQQALDYNRGRKPGAGIGPNQVRPGNGPPRVPGTRENPAVVGKPDDVRFLPSGTWFRAPDGRVMQRR